LNGLSDRRRADRRDPGQGGDAAVDGPRFWAFLNEDRRLEIESRISKRVRDGMAALHINVKNSATATAHGIDVDRVARSDPGQTAWRGAIHAASVTRPAADILLKSTQAAKCVGRVLEDARNGVHV